MKHRQSSRNTEASSLSKKDFSIQASGKMFHMIISGLYSNKPKSITREIYSNAFDAHAMVGKHDVPFDVIFPTPMDPTFTVRDYGPGIHHDNMEGFYTILGHSTKEDTNTAVGKWGVGRLSPMSYTDSFSVVSRHKGMKAYYSVQLGNDGEPALHTLSNPTPTDEPDGLEVSFPIDRYDIRNFADAARHMAMGLKVKPNVVNDAEPFEDVEVTVRGEKFYFYKENRNTQSGPFAQMGCVLYPIDPGYVPYQFYLTNLVLEFDIGELDVTASREDLSYDEETIKNIESRFKKLEAQIRSIATDKVLSAKTEFEARKFCGQAYRETRLKNFEVDWNNITISHDNYMMPLSGVASSLLDVSGKSKAYWNPQQRPVVSSSRLEKVYVQDVAKKIRDVRANERVYNHYHQQQKAHSIWLRYDSTNQEHLKEIEELKREFNGHVEFVYVKDIPDPGNTQTRSKTKVKKVSGYRWLDVELSNQDFQDGGYYVPISNNMPDGAHTNWSFFKEVLAKVEREGDVYLVPKTYWKKFEGASQWKTLRSFVDDYVSKDTKKKIEYALSDWSSNRDVSDLSKLPVSNQIFTALRRKHQEKVAPVDNLSKAEMSVLLKATGKIYREVKDYPTKYVDMIFDKYPLLRLYNGRAMNQEFADYVHMIDAQSNENLAA
jgi:hypothetical protein